MFRPLWAEVLDNELPETGAQQDAGFSRASTGQVNHLEFCGFRILYQPPYRPTSFKHGLMVLYEKVFVALMISSICGFALFLLRCL